MKRLIASVAHVASLAGCSSEPRGWTQRICCERDNQKALRFRTPDWNRKSARRSPTLARSPHPRTWASSMRPMPRLAPGESRAFFFSGDRDRGAGSVSYGAAPMPLPSLNFLLSINPALF